MLVFVFLNKNPQNIHQGSEGMIFVFPNFVGDTIEKLYKLPVIRFSVRHPDGALY
jgi:hypothetical protein